MADPWAWNPHSILFEVAFCMTAYVMIALDFENLAPLLERLEDQQMPKLVRDVAGYAKRFVRTAYPYGVALALALPTMHQSSLGSLMLLGATRVHPLWQTSLLPLFYVVMAFILGIAFVELVLMASCAVWRRPIDRYMLASLSDIVSWTALAWIAIRFTDVVVRHQVARRRALRFLQHSVPGGNRSDRRARAGVTLQTPAADALQGLRGARHPHHRRHGLSLYPHHHRLPARSGLPLFSLRGRTDHHISFIALAMVGFLFTVKHFAILPATLEMSVLAANKSVEKGRAA